MRPTVLAVFIPLKLMTAPKRDLRGHRKDVIVGNSFVPNPLQLHILILYRFRMDVQS